MQRISSSAGFGRTYQSAMVSLPFRAKKREDRLAKKRLSEKKGRSGEKKRRLTPGEKKTVPKRIRTRFFITVTKRNGARRAEEEKGESLKSPYSDGKAKAARMEET